MTTIADTIRATHASEASAEGWRYKILVDGLCPLCVREANFMRRLDRGRGYLKIVDITEQGFDPADYGATHDEVMGKIHGVGRDGGVETGMQVFRRAYGVLGWGWLIAWTGWPVVKPLIDRFYVWFARNRLRLTGRDCEDGRCRV